ncbi:secretion protein F [Dehalobacterium formicoaceticum]|uniref:secretion protein F n=1 Tax=Dehalobacterium formicoaceticum TaxID=51515 RepID=UPI0031F6414A
MYGILFFSGLLFAAGAYFISAGLLNLPTLATTRAVIQAGRTDKRKTKNFESVVLELASRLSKLIRLDKYKRRKTEATLKSAGIQMTPETFMAKAIVKAGFAALGILPAFYIFPLLCPVLMFLSIAIYFKEIMSADEALKKKRNEIEYELPRFVSTVAQQLKATRDVLSILEKYRQTAGTNMRNELDITIADMQSGNLETALVRFESRMGSAMLSDVVRGLVGVIRGDNGVNYFELLAHDFKQFEIQRLKLLAMKRPGKIRKYSFFMLACFILMYLGILFMEIMTALSGLF